MIGSRIGSALIALIVLVTGGCATSRSAVMDRAPEPAPQPVVVAPPVSQDRAVTRPRPSPPPASPLPGAAPQGAGNPGAPAAPAANAVTTPIGRGAAVATLAAASAALLASAQRHQQAGELDAAAADIERALRQEPNQARLWLELAEIRLRQNRRDQARTLLRRAEAAGIADAATRQRAVALARRLGGSGRGPEEAE